jgi:hypothetical protein
MCKPLPFLKAADGRSWWNPQHIGLYAVKKSRQRPSRWAVFAYVSGQEEPVELSRHGTKKAAEAALRELADSLGGMLEVAS